MTLATQGNVVPIWRDILADMETPVSAFLRIAHRPNAFLLESVEGGERMARYSFFGSDPYATFRSKGATAWITESDAPPREIALAEGRDPLHVLEETASRVFASSRCPDYPASSAARSVISATIGFAFWNRLGNRRPTI